MYRLYCSLLLLLLLPCLPAPLRMSDTVGAPAVTGPAAAAVWAMMAERTSKQRGCALILPPAGEQRFTSLSNCGWCTSIHARRHLKPGGAQAAGIPVVGMAPIVTYCWGRAYHLGQSISPDVGVRSSCWW